MLNIIVDENIPLLKDVLESGANVTRAAGRTIDNRMLLERETDILIVRSITKINSKLLKNTNVKFVGTSTSGIDHVDTEYLNRNNIAFAYAPGSNANSVAEYVVYSILMWAKANNIDIKGKTIGVVGYGNIGKIVVAYSQALGLNVLVNDPPLKDAGYDFPPTVKYAGLKEICEKSEIITNHVPLTREGKYPTYGLFGEENFEVMKKGVLFINASRGFVAEENAMLKRLIQRKIMVASDVWENEPYVNPTAVKYCFLATPHIAGYSYDGKLKGALMMTEAVEEFTGEIFNKNILFTELNTGAEKTSVYENPKKILENLEVNRKLSEDYVVFLHTMLLDDREIRADEFDRQRKEYPHRRECLFL